MTRQAGRFINQGNERCDCGAKPGDAHGLACHPDNTRLSNAGEHTDLRKALEEIREASVGLGSDPEKHILALVEINDIATRALNRRSYPTE